MSIDRPFRVYIAGPMRGIKDYNFPAFDAAAEWVKQQGWEPVSPAEMDREAGIENNHPVSESLLREIFRRDILALLGCDGILLLKGWDTSEGAMLELQIARVVGLEERYWIQEMLLHGTSVGD